MSALEPPWDDLDRDVALKFLPETVVRALNESIPGPTTTPAEYYS